MEYNKDFVTLLADVKPITNVFGINKIADDKIKVKFKGDTIGFIITAPVEYFPFPSDFVGFLDFDRFMKYFNIFDVPNKDEKLADTPILDWNTTDAGAAGEIIIKSSKGKQKFTYRTGTAKAIREQKFESLVLPSIDATFTLTEAQNTHLHKIISIVKPEIIAFNFSGDVCKVTLTNMIFKDTYEIEYKLDNAVTEDFGFSVSAESVTLIPNGEYKLEATKRGHIAFHQVRTDKITFDLAFSKVKER